MRSKYLSATALVALALAACGGKDNGPSYASAADSATISTLAEGADNLASNALTEAFGGQGSTLTGFLALSKGAARPSVTERVNALVQHELRLASVTGNRAGGSFAPVPSFSAPFSECVPTQTGVDSTDTPIDTDGDGIPDNWYVNFGSACVSEDSAGTQRETVSGSLRFQDTDHGFLSFSLTFSSLKIKIEDLSSGDFTEIALNGNEAAQFAAALASHTTDFSVTQSLKSGANTISLTVANTESSSFDPDGAGTLALGDPLPAGVFDFSSDFRVLGANSGGEVPGNFRLTVSTPTPLHYNPACGSGDIDSGILRGLLNGNSNIGFTITWSACNTTTFDIFGNTEPTA